MSSRAEVRHVEVSLHGEHQVHLRLVRGISFVNVKIVDLKVKRHMLF